MKTIDRLKRMFQRLKGIKEPIPTPEEMEIIKAYRMKVLFEPPCFRLRCPFRKEAQKGADSHKMCKDT